jgi:predicted MFS family arabinose efflux permease
MPVICWPISPVAFAYAGVLYAGAGRARAISRIYAAAAGSEVVLLPLLAFIGDESSWRWSFGVMALAALGFFLAAIITLPRRARDPSARLSPRAVVRAYLPILRDRPLALLYLAQFLRGICWTGMLAYIGAFIDDELGYSLRVSGLVWMVLGPGFLVGSLLVGGRLRRVHPRRMFMCMTGVMAITIALTFLMRGTIGPTFALLLVVAIAGGAAEVVTATAISAESRAPQGPTMSLHSSTLRYGTAVGALVGGALLALGGYDALGLGLAIIGFAGVACAWRSMRRVAEAAPISASAVLE